MTSETEEFRSMRCDDTGRYYHCELLMHNKVVDDVYAEEVNVKKMGNTNNNVTRINEKAFTNKFDITFNEKVTGRVGPEESSLEIVMD